VAWLLYLKVFLPDFSLSAIDATNTAIRDVTDAHDHHDLHRTDGGDKTFKRSQPRLLRLVIAIYHGLMARSEMLCYFAMVSPRLLSHAMSYAMSHALSHAMSHALSHAMSHAMSYAMSHAMSHALSHALSHAMCCCKMSEGVEAGRSLPLGVEESGLVCDGVP
jgi:hypothetical protein